MKKKADRRKDPLALQSAFFRKAGPNALVLKQLMDLLPDISTYIKDAKGRFMAINARNRELCGMGREEDVIGKRSSDFFDKEISAYILARDREVLESGKAIVNRHETRTARNAADPISISVFPIRDAKGKIIGTACCHFHNEEFQTREPLVERIAEAAHWMDRYFRDNLEPRELARRFGFTRSSFYRLFKRVYRSSPREYVRSLRVKAAQELLLTTDKPISEIAAETGFFDQSHFVRIFRKYRGTTPSDFRRSSSS